MESETSPNSHNTPNESLIHRRTNDYLLKIFVGSHRFTQSDIKRILEKKVPRMDQQEQEKSNFPLKSYFTGCTRVGKSPNSSYLFLSFDSELAKNTASQILCAIKHKGTSWKETPVFVGDMEDPIDRNLKRKRDKESRPKTELALSEMENYSCSKGDVDRKTNPSSSTAPWTALSYESQLEKKTKHCSEVLEKIRHEVYQADRRALSGFSNFSSSIELPPAIPFAGLSPSPELYGYRNRVDFTIGLGCEKEGDHMSSLPRVGFNLGAVKDGHFAVSSPEYCPCTPQIAILIAQRFEKWVQLWYNRCASLFRSYDKSLHCGFWRRLSVRMNQKGETMMIVQTTRFPDSNEKEKDSNNSDDANHSTELSYTHTREKLYQSLLDEFSSGVRCIFWQEHDGVSNAAPWDLPFKLLFGPSHLEERMDGIPFLISPGSFFQVNTKASEALLRQIKQHAKLSSDTILLDLCCGTGLLGLFLRSQVHWVIGVEAVHDAVQDAKRNTQAQNAQNVSYLEGKVENLLTEITKTLSSVQEKRARVLPKIESGENITMSKDSAESSERSMNSASVVALVDPPREGLHGNMVRWLRSMRSITQIVYVSCNQNALIRDATDLMKRPTKKYPNTPFTPQLSLAVDLFPHTPHVEQVLFLSR